jgi:arginine/serine-rich splicing factor 2
LLRFCCWVLRTGDSRGFAFVRYKYADEAQKAIDRLDGVLRLFSRCLFLPVGIVCFFGELLLNLEWFCAGRNVDGRNIMVQFAKYGPNAEPM